MGVGEGRRGEEWEDTLLASYPGSSSAGEEPGYETTLYEVTLTK